ncbi:response regulator [Flavobacterium zepuense]|uniref:Response regulator n=1 Tax=Flavobacterium zepuense TaxID=2593302 RepID=A0A552VA94_9FLAO|nr:sigma 54-interacting response regulator [Flavobacterium zepuense]TRW27280.1 response regulator [Flavobacterium zepuense]
MDTATKILIVEDHFLEANHLRLMLNNAGYTVSGIARTVEEAKKSIANDKPGLVLLDIFLLGKGTGIDLAGYLREQHIGFIYLSANSNEDILNAAKATHPYGFLVKPYREKDLLIAMQIAGYHQQYGLESSIRKEQLFQAQLQDLITTKGSWEERLFKVSRALQPLIPFDLIITVYHIAEFNEDRIYGFLRTGFDEYKIINNEEFQSITNLKAHELKKLQEDTVVDSGIVLYAEEAFQKLTQKPSMKRVIAEHLGMRCNLTLPVPLAISRQGNFFFSFFSRKPDGLTQVHADVCRRLQQPLIYMVENIVLKDTTTHTTVNPKPEFKKVETKTEFDGIIGKSPLLMGVFDYVNQVALAETTVLITGESGTGKERIAGSIHNLSTRKMHPYIKVNCAALPQNLIETELFGHEKGAFTGATTSRVGRFEQANKGTIFLDEVGEMPMEMQVKLLRVLQEKEIERIGGNTPIKVDVRIIAATNRNLEKEVAEGRFRLDLYYRLNVFPIRMPSLRERREDIPLLAQHFITRVSRKIGKNVDRLSDTALKSLLSYTWPGNIRELENLMERCVLLANGPVIEELPLPAVSSFNDKAELAWQERTIEENERMHIISTLNRCGGKIRGSNGAAVLLGVPPTTLASKMLKLGIERKR